MLDNQHIAFTPQYPANFKKREHGRVVRRVRRIKKSYAPNFFRTCCCATKKILSVVNEDLRGLFGRAADFEILFDKPAHLARAINEGDVRCAARESFDADRAGACAEVQKACACDA